MSTPAERTILVPFESRVVFIERRTTSDDRTVHVTEEQ
jgi:hypothetical protein